MCVCVCMSVTDRAIESTYRENLTTPLHPECLCPHGYTLPSSPSFFAPPAQHVLSQRCTPACLKLSHSPGALSSVGGNTLKVVSHYRVKCNTPVGCTVHIFKCTLVKEKKKLLFHSNAEPALSTAQSLAGYFLRYILCVSCVHCSGVKHIPKNELAGCRLVRKWKNLREIC